MTAALAVAVTTSPWVDTGEPAAAASSSDAGDGAEGSAENPNSATAAVHQAAASGHRVEDVAQRTETTQVFANPDGTWTAETASGPVRVVDEETGKWAPIDTDLEATSAGIVPKSALGGLVLSDGGTEPFARLDVPDETGQAHEISWRWPTALPAPSIDGNVVTYKDAVEGGDLVVTATPSGFRHDIVLRRAPELAPGVDAAVYKIPVVTGTESDAPRLNIDSGNQLSIETTDGDELVTAPPPVIYDAKTTSSGEPAQVLPASAEVRQQAGGSELTLSVSESFLTDPNTRYPVTVDPSFTTYALQDTWISSQQDTAGAAYRYAQDLRVGSPNGGTLKTRTFLNFATSAWAGKTIDSAQLRLSNFDSLTCTASSIQAARITELWEHAKIRWGDQPAVTTAGAANYATARGASGCPAGQAVWTVTSMVQQWANGEPQRGIRLAALSETSANAYRRYRSVDFDAASTATPRLTVQYSDPTPAPIAITGTIPNVENLDPAQLIVNIAPNSATQESMALNSNVLNYGIPSSAVTVSGSDFTIRVDPASIPSDYVDPDGVTDFEVLFTDVETGMTAFTQETVRRNAANTDWLPADLPTSGTAPANSDNPPDNTDTTVDSPATADDESDEASVPPTANGSSSPGPTGPETPGGTVSAAATLASNECDGPCPDWSEPTAQGAVAQSASGQTPARVRTGPVAKRVVEATIATTYPVLGEKAWATYNASTEGTFGVAVSVGSGFRQESKSTKKMGFEQVYAKDVFSRSYRANIRYVKWLSQNPVTGVYFTRWKPEKLTGGTKAYRLNTKRPNWGNCQYVAAGQWSRYNEDGKSYNTSAGVKIKDIIGIDLSAGKEYSSNSRVYYTVSAENSRRMCGSNDFPSMASKVMMRGPE